VNISFLLLRDFRNYPYLELPLSPGVSLFFGYNAAGKTNLLEACYYLSTLTSPRAERDHDLARWGSESFSVGCRVEHEDTQQTIKADVIVAPSLKRKVTVNNVPVKRAQLTSVFPCVYFSPDDLYMVKRGSQLRRKFLDSLFSRLDPDYGRQLTRYQDVLSRRNVTLKKMKGDPSWRKTLETLDEVLVQTGTAVLWRRLQGMADLRREILETYRFVSGDECEVAYEPSVADLREEMSADVISGTYRHRLSELHREESERGITLVGPHRDDIVLSLSGRPVRYFGSQGEQRSSALALKMAEARMLEQVFEKKPVLLLDDVFSELDEDRRRKVLSLCDFGHQILITSTDRLEGMRVGSQAYRVGGGAVEAVKGEARL
jgi:DNA replication and repair protein RecF